MTKPRIQGFNSLRDEMIAVAKGERSAPAHAAEPSVESAEVLARLLTPENRFLMSVIRDETPASVAELAELTNRAAPNVTRTLDKLVAVGLVRLVAEGRRKVPRVAVRKITIEIDPFSNSDSVAVTPAYQVRRAAMDRRSIKHVHKGRIVGVKQARSPAKASGTVGKAPASTRR